MAQKEKSKKIKKSSMRINSKKRKSAKSVTVKTIKFVRATKKMRTIAKKAMKKALKGVPKIRQSVYKKIDIAVARNLQGTIEDAVITVINGALEKAKAPKARKKSKKKEKSK